MSWRDDPVLIGGREPPRGCLAVFAAIFCVAGLQGLAAREFRWLGRGHLTIPLVGTEAVVASAGYLAWAVALLLAIGPALPYRKAAVYVLLLAGMLMKFAAPFAGEAPTPAPDTPFGSSP